MTFVHVQSHLTNVLELNIPLNSVQIILSENLIVNIPFDFFIKFDKLETIELNNNLLTELNFYIPETVTYLNLENNHIGRNQIKTLIPATLEYVIMTGNPYHNFHGLGNAKNIEYGNVTVTRNDQPVVWNVPINHVQNNKAIENDPIINTDVHASEVGNNIRKSINYIISKKSSHNYLNEMIKYNNKKSLFKNLFYYIGIYDEFSRLLIHYNNIETDIVIDYNTYKVCKISDILNGIWALAKNHSQCENMILSLYEQMKDGKDYCFVGKYTRIVNSMTSFDDHILINDISNNEKISNKITYLKSKKIPQNEIIQELKIYMVSLKISEEEQNVWIDALEDL